MRSESSRKCDALSGKPVLAPQAARREAASGREATLPPQELHGGRQNALRLAEAAEVLGEEGAVRGRTELEDEGLQVVEVSLERILRHELVLPHRVQLFHGVIEVVRDRRRLRAPKLRGRPGLDLVRREVGGIVEQEIDRIGDHQRRQSVGQVALELEERLANVRIERLLFLFPRHAGKHSPEASRRRGIGAPW